MLIIRRRPGRLTQRLPDGLDDLADYNLITFKSFREALTDWVLKELTGHYVNYRKLVSPRGRLLPEDRFRLYAVCARRPRDLFAALPPESVCPGVYVCRRGTDAIRVIVGAELPRAELNALLHLFSAFPEQVQYGAEHYRMQSPDLSTIVNDLFEEYRVEGLTMPYTIDDYRRDLVRRYLPEMTPAERLQGLSPAERLQGLSVEELLAALPAEQILAYAKRLEKRPTTAKTAKKKQPKRGG